MLSKPKKEAVLLPLPWSLQFKAELVWLCRRVLRSLSAMCLPHVGERQIAIPELSL